MGAPPARARRLAALAAAALALAGCAAPPADPSAGAEPLTARAIAAPPGAPEGSCWVEDAAPALFETVTEQVAMTGPDGATLYRTETHQRLLRPRQTLRFRVPCPATMDSAFIATLQRALIVRGFLEGPATGVMDAPTRRAVRRFQALRGLDSATLSWEAARDLGLLAWDLADL